MADGICLTIAVTVFHTTDEVLRSFLDSVNEAAATLEQARPSAAVALIIVDNSDGGRDAARLGTLIEAGSTPKLHARLLSGHGNVGYGAANNLALLPVQADILIVANPDLTLDKAVLIRLVEALEREPDVGLITPCFVEDGASGHLCKRFPSFAVLFGRGFLPPALKPLLKRVLDRYRMAEHSPNHDFWDPPIVSGAFMAFRSSVFKAVGGFDERFFLYFEDFDLSLRVSSVARILYDSHVKVSHAGGHTARRGFRLIGCFARSALSFWVKHGFRFIRVEDTSPRRASLRRNRPAGA